MSSKTRHSHVHKNARDFWGAFESVALCEWLNRKKKDRGTPDPVEKLILLNEQLNTPLRDVAGEIRSLVARVVSKYAVASAPVVGDISVHGWEVSWRVVGRLPMAQGLALLRVVQLAEKGMLSHVRRCGWKECNKWFFQKVSHQNFHSNHCQQRANKSTEQWKKKHREYMKQMRHADKQRAQKSLNF